MEQIIDNLLGDFERGKMSRRQLIQALAVGTFAGAAPPLLSATPALSAEPLKMKAVWVNHYAYRVADYARTRDFYADLLGMQVINDDGKECGLKFGNTVIKARKTPNPDGKPDIGHVAYVIENWDEKAVEAELKRRGLNPRTDTGGATISFHIKDPDGYDVELTSPKGT